MNPPLDYPIETEGQPIESAQADLTIATLLDRHASAQPVTTEMIEQACRRIQAAEEFKEFTTDTDIDRGMARFLKVFRPD